jgi:UTP--glucose-1-phosphate uridylyltransferase
MGRYVLSPKIFEILERIPLGRGGELQLTDAINELNKHQAVFAYNFEGSRYDIGDKIGFIKATIDFALCREDIRESVLAYLQEVTMKENFQNSKREID